MSVTAKRVFISSTSIDLPEHRQKVIAACVELGHFPDGMEHWPAADDTALDLSLKKVDRADLFIGVYAHRYGWIPPGQKKSITELEYDRALERDIPRLLFLMSDKHPVLPGQWDTGRSADSLEVFKQRIQIDRVRATFDNADQLRAEVLHALGEVGGNVYLETNDAPKIDLTHLPAGAANFLGRESELATLDAAWDSNGKTTIVELVAHGGTGKTALVKRWLENLKVSGWRSARRIFAWSFYSQGASNDRNASEDAFLAEAIKWFGIAPDPSLNPADKGRALAEAIATTRTLLILDGLEPLQHPPGPLAGQLRASGLHALLTHFASAGPPVLCLITSREQVKDIDEWAHGSGGTALRLDLGNLSETDGARLLHAEGANKAGNAPIEPDDNELKLASRAVMGHALSLALLGRYLAMAHGGDIFKRHKVRLLVADAEAGRGHAFRVIAAYEHWFANKGKAPRELAALRLLGFFDRPASKEDLKALRANPVIPSLTRALFLKPTGLLGFLRKPTQPIPDEQWHTTLKRLQECRLLEFDTNTGSIDAHPLVREYFAAFLEKRLASAWKEGHHRLYEQLKISVPGRPNNLTDLQSLYRAIWHACLIKLHQEAFRTIYADRILRHDPRNEFFGFGVRTLGAYGADLAAIASFFDKHWTQPAKQMNLEEQAWLLVATALRLRSLGRPQEALEPIRRGAQIAADQNDWAMAATSTGYLSQLLLVLGNVDEAVATAEIAVKYADQSGNHSHRLGNRTTLADALHQRGDCSRAAAFFEEAERMQEQQNPNHPRLMTLRGFRYCDLLLAKAERVAWNNTVCKDGCDDCKHVANRAEEAEDDEHYVLNSALNHLTLARCALYTDLLQGRTPNEEARQQTETAVDCLRRAGTRDHLPRGLLTRAWLRHCLGDIEGAQADLNEAQRIAERGGMKLHLADIALTRGRLFKDKAELAKARRLIEECGYGRRLPELEDAEKRLAATQ